MTQRQVNFEKLSKAFCKLTDALMEETSGEDKSRKDVGVHIGASANSSPSILGLRNTRAQNPISDDNKRKSDRKGEMPDVSPNM